VELQRVRVNLPARCGYLGCIYFGGTAQKNQLIQLDTKPGFSNLEAITLVTKYIILATYISSYIRFQTLLLLLINVFFCKKRHEVITTFYFP